MLFWFPMAFNGFLLRFWFSAALMQVQVDYFFFLLYMASLLLPFIMLFSLPEMTRKWFNRGFRVIAPIAHIVQGQ
jgi:hypothetical protein